MFDLSYMAGELRTVVVLVAEPRPSLCRIKTVGVSGSGVWPGWWYTAALHPWRYLALGRCTEGLCSFEYKCRPLLPFFIMKTAIIVLFKHNKLKQNVTLLLKLCVGFSMPGKISLSSFRTPPQYLILDLLTWCPGIRGSQSADILRVLASSGRLSPSPGWLVTAQGTRSHLAAAIQRALTLSGGSFQNSITWRFNWTQPELAL